MTTRTPQDYALEHAERLLREAAKDLMDGISLKGVPQWEDEPATEAAYLDHTKAADGLAGLLSINQWISVEERLPKAGKSVLACNALGFFGRANWDGKRWNHIGRTTHWRYVDLPPSTKGEPT